MKESIFTPEDRHRFANNVPETGHTPDVMIFFRGRHRRLLIVIEAKMFDNVTLPEMGAQLELQRQNVLSKVIEPLKLTWGMISFKLRSFLKHLLLTGRVINGMARKFELLRGRSSLVLTSMGARNHTS